MPLSKNICLLFSFLLHFTLHPVYIVIHGTFAEDAQWSQPGGKFFDTLEREAHQRGHHLISFGWSGDNQHVDRVQGGRSLAKLILSYPADEEKIIIGHSHAGNVIAMASQFLSSDSEEWVEIHQNAISRSQPQKNSFPLDVYRQAIRDVSWIKENMKDKKETSEDFFYLDKVYFLGTPIDEEYYQPDMTTINNLYNFYSRGDMVQQVFWMYKRLLSDHPRIVNFRVTLEEAGWLGWGNPTHTQMHDPIIAEWILAIPLELKAQRMGRFEVFDGDRNGKIHFTCNGVPQFKLDKKTTNEREVKEAEKMEKVS